MENTAVKEAVQNIPLHVFTHHMSREEPYGMLKTSCLTQENVHMATRAYFLL